MVVLLGSDHDLKNKVLSKILNPSQANAKSKSQSQWSEDSGREESQDVVVIYNPHNVDINQLMTLSSPGPHAFMLVLAEGERSKDELERWEGLTGQKNMYHYTTFVVDKPRFGKTAAKCLNLADKSFLEECKNIWAASIPRPYCYYNVELSAPNR